MDQDLYLKGLGHQLLEYPENLREQKLFFEFTLFLKSYLQCKQYIKEGHVLDAFSNILDALHHWARIVIVEEGFHPESTVWAHIRRINPGVYKLYEELTQSKETLEQRVQLVLLACEFSVMSKMERCCAMLTRILASENKLWSPDELKAHPELGGITIELASLLNKMAQKSLIKEVAVTVDQDMSLLELKYTTPISSGSVDSE